MSAHTKAYLLAVEVKVQAESELSHLRMRQRELSERIRNCQTILAELEPFVCTECNGHGATRIWQAQDESRLETCKTCGGTGEGCVP